MNTVAANTKAIDLLNIGLIFISLVIAFEIPFELFLFSYAVLGPLHYLTEINWLKDKNYFVKERKWVWVFILIAALITIPVVLKVPGFKTTNGDRLLGYIHKLGKEFFFSIFFITFLFSISLVYLSKWHNILVAFIASILLAVFIIKFKLFTLAFFGMFLPTILHVYLFTLLFMIYGTIKTKNFAGIIGCFFLLLCPLIICAFPINMQNYQVSEKVQTTFLKSDFQNISSYIAQLMGGLAPDGKFYLISATGIKIQIFIAFCYTYHYLNWFSKTSIIRWNKNISKGKLALVLAVWCSALLLYWHDYKIGFAALFTLSLIHVFFEFPLNVISVQGIFKSLFSNNKT